MNTTHTLKGGSLPGGRFALGSSAVGRSGVWEWVPPQADAPPLVPRGSQKLPYVVNWAT